MAGQNDSPPTGLDHKLRFRLDPLYRRNWRRLRAAEEALDRAEAELARLRPVADAAESARALKDIPYLAALNADLARLRELAPRRLQTPGEQLVPGVACQFKPDAGVRAEAAGGDSFLLTLESRGESPWFALSIRLPLGQMQIARWFGVSLAGSAPHAATAGGVIRAAKGGTWSDLTLPQELVFTAREASNVSVLEVAGAPELADADHADLLLFFRQGAFRLTLSGISVFCAV